MQGELYERCPTCEGVQAALDCEECSGVGFIPTGLTFEMFSQLLGRLEEIKGLAESLVGILQHGDDRRRKRNGKGEPPTSGRGD